MVILGVEGVLDMLMTGTCQGDPCPQSGRLGEGRVGSRLWRRWGGAEVRTA